jgi:hypothetical protein
MAIVRDAAAELAAAGAEEAPRGSLGRALRRYAPIGIGAVLALAMIVMAALAPLIAPLSPSAQFSDAVLKGPGAVERHALGTDEFGRDILSRIIWGARVSLQVGLASVIFGFALGVPLGILAGFQGGRIESCIMRGADMLMAFPTLLLALIIVTALGGSLPNEILAIGVALTPNFVRLARSLALTIREQDYIVAARALGMITRPTTPAGAMTAMSGRSPSPVPLSIVSVRKSGLAPAAITSAAVVMRSDRSRSSRSCWSWRLRSASARCPCNVTCSSLTCRRSASFSPRT